jgi:hypothetical protein
MHMSWPYFLANAAFLLWVIFLGGARRIEGSWLAAWEFHALASEGQIKFLAWVWLIILALCWWQLA